MDVSASDSLDLAADFAERERAALVARRAGSGLAHSVPGECDECGRDAPRLIAGVCVPCRNAAD